MQLLILDLLVFMAVATTVAYVYACAPAAQRGAGEEWPATAIDCRLLQSHWRELSQARDWDSLYAQVRRWHEFAAPGCAPAVTEQVARDLNAAVFGFAVPEN